MKFLVFQLVIKFRFFCKRIFILILYNYGYTNVLSSELCIAKVFKGKTLAKQDFRTLINDYSAQVLNTAMRILGDTHKAQDIHQEVFLAIWRRWHKYDGRTNWSAYLYRITVRKAIKLTKQSRTEQLSKQQQKYANGQEKPDELLRTAELQRKLSWCLAKLPKRQAEVFVLSRMEGLKAEKIAELLGCSQETVRVHLHRAIRRLARELSDYLIE